MIDGIILFLKINNCTMQKTCTATLYLCTRKLNVELKFGAYDRVGKMGMVNTSKYSVLWLVDIRHHSC